MESSYLTRVDREVLKVKPPTLRLMTQELAIEEEEDEDGREAAVGPRGEVLETGGAKRPIG